MDKIPQVGERAPDFSLPDVKNNPVSLQRLLNENKSAVLVFYRGGWCPLCSKQLADISSHLGEFEKKNAIPVAISNEEIKKGSELLKKLELGYRLLSDKKSEIIDKFGVRVVKREMLDMSALKGKHKDYALPSVFVIGSDGKIIWRYIGKNYRDRPKTEEILKHLP